LFANGRFASLIGAEFSGTVEVPKFPVIDDSWRQSLSSSADISVESSVEDSPHRVKSSGSVPHTSVVATASSVLFSPLNSTGMSSVSTAADSMSLSSLQSCLSDKKHKGKRRLKTIRESNISDTHSGTPSVLFPYKQRRLKCCLSVDEDSLANCGPSDVQEQLEWNLSQSLPVTTCSSSEPEEIKTRKRRRLKRSLIQTLPLDSDKQAEAVITKRRRKSSVHNTLLPQTQKKMLAAATVIVTPSRVQALSEVRGNDTEADGIQAACSSDGISTVNSPASVPSRLCLQNLLTGTCYVLQPVAKASSHTDTDNSLLLLFIC